jgi:HPt (histidine-containing phosphotransfer) domain-containing protein
MAKPMPVGEFHAAVLRLCGLDAVPLWRADKALRVLAHNPQAVASLKALFHAEVPSMTAAVRAALDAGDLKTLGDVLHKLKASCGFLGAERLLAECRALDAAPGPEALARFERVCAETLAAI